MGKFFDIHERESLEHIVLMEQHRHVFYNKKKKIEKSHINNIINLKENKKKPIWNRIKWYFKYNY